MKKIAILAVMLALVTPAMAATSVTIDACSIGTTGNVAIIYNATGGDVSGFGLDVNVSTGTITAISGYHIGESTAGSKGYGIFPGTIDINDTTGNVDSYGNPVALSGDPGALGGIGTSGITLEIGALYTTGNAPGRAGTLCTVTVSGTCNLKIALNTTRGGVVDVNAADATTPGLPRTRHITKVSNYTISGQVTGSVQDGVTMSGLPNSPVTSGGGLYSDTVSAGWNGTVTPTKTGYTFAPANRTYSNVTSNQTGQGYTATAITYTISGTATGSLLPGVTMNGLPGNPVTDANGNYTGTVSYGWSGTVTPTKAGYTFVPTNRTYSNVTSNQTAQDYVGTLLTYTISGNVVTGAAPVVNLAGVTMSGLPGTPVTDGSGNYTSTVNYGWSGTATPTKTQWSFAPATLTYSNVTANQTAQNYTANATECLKSTAAGYSYWSGTFSSPNCWCYRKQCNGDGNGIVTFGNRVTSADFNILKSAYNIATATLASTYPAGICADFNHTITFGNPVTSADFNILKTYYNIADGSVPECSAATVNKWTN